MSFVSHRPHASQWHEVHFCRQTGVHLPKQTCVCTLSCSASLLECVLIWLHLPSQPFFIRSSPTSLFCVWLYDLEPMLRSPCVLRQSHLTTWPTTPNSLRNQLAATWVTKPTQVSACYKWLAVCVLLVLCDWYSNCVVYCSILT